MKKMMWTVFFWSLAFIGSVSFAAEQGKIKDTESTTHGDDAAKHQIVDSYKFPGFEVVQINLPVLSHYSYILISGKEALIVDPDRDGEFYLDFVSKRSLRIKGVYLTHSHADFVAGHLEIVKASDCPIYQSASSGAAYKINPMKDGSTFKIGSAVVKVLETPGHTPDGTCGLVFSGEEDKVGQVLFTGDTLFVGSVGRPDLLEGKMTAATLASMGFDTWHNKLSKLADTVMVLPAHGAGSLCGAHLSDSPKSTIGAERASNPYFTLKGRSEFIAAVLKDLPEAPQYFKHNAAMNRQGPALVNWTAPVPAEVKAEQALMDTSKFYLVDIRDSLVYAAEHIPGSVNIGIRGRFETWAGIMVPWAMHESDKLVVLGSKAELKEALYRLHRIGYEASVLTPETWKAAKLPTKKVEFIKPVDLYSQMKAGTAPIIVDVRLPNEWMGLRIGEVVNLPLTHLKELSAKLDPTQPVVTVCNSAYRSSMAIGLLEAKGFQSVTSLAGGSEAWIDAGLPVYGAETAAPAAGAGPVKREIRLADRMSADELRRMAKDLPGTFDLVDIRPADQFKDYHIPGSRNAEVADVLNNPAYLTGAGPLILVDRDGSLAMQIAGILSQKTQRTVKALHGGLESYWKDSGWKDAAKAVAAPPSPVLPAAPAKPDSPKAEPSKAPKKKSAGC
ncbi:MAG: beta-lactamase domain protein [Deltaproteobacteria bacterium]|nr:beta-lactamase domain protein [Deltaproteobacteria bacterium]